MVLTAMTHSEIRHVGARRIWSFIYEEIELSLDEQRHLNLCIDCATVFRLCVTCDNFESVLKELQMYGDSAEAA